MDVKRYFVLLSNYKFSILLAIALTIILFTIQPPHSLSMIGYVATNVALVILALWFFSKMPKYASILLIVLFSLFVSIDLSFYIIFESTMGKGHIAAFFNTDMREATGFMGDNKMFMVWLIIFVGTVLLGLMIRKEMKDNKLSKKVIGPAFVVLLVAMAGYTISREYRQDEFYNTAFKGYLREQPVTFGLTTFSRKAPLVVPSLSSLGIYLHEIYDFNKKKNMPKSMPEGIEIKSDHASSLKIYFVVGESASREHLSLYGYPVPTTPFLDSIATDTAALAYYKGISPAALTRDALRFTFSFATPIDKEPFFTQKNIVEMARSTGYETVWITNQYSEGSLEYYPQHVAKMSDIFVDGRTDLKSDDLEDLHLLNLMEKNTNSSKKQFVAFHQTGSHGPYVSFDKKDDAYFASLNLPDDANRNYDKTITHLDRFLKKLVLYSLKNDESSIIIYYSDHGEIVNIGHGIMNGEVNQYKIPILFFSNNVGFDIRNIADKYVDKETGLMNSDALPYILAEVMGYSVDETVVEKALMDGKYILQPDGTPILFKDLNN